MQNREYESQTKTPYFSEPSSEIVGQVRPGSMGLTAEQDIMTMEMRLSVFRDAVKVDGKKDSIYDKGLNVKTKVNGNGISANA